MSQHKKLLRHKKWLRHHVTAQKIFLTRKDFHVVKLTLYSRLWVLKTLLSVNLSFSYADHDFKVAEYFLLLVYIPGAFHPGSRNLFSTIIQFS